MMHQPIWRTGRLGRLVGPYLRLLVPGLLVVVGFVLVVDCASSSPSGRRGEGEFLQAVPGHHRASPGLRASFSVLLSDPQLA